jgi:SAM-dependent methyltransferase
VSFRHKVVRALWRATPFKRAVQPAARAVRDAVWAPWNWLRTARACRVLAIDYGHVRSAAMMRSVDRHGEPLPWITYPAIEYLQRFDFSDKRVFEYGCGNSTRFWAQRAAQVVSVEHERAFYELIASQLPANCELALRTPADVYVGALAAYSSRDSGRRFDVIVIDGHSRVRCAEGAAKHLAPGGLIILDNSDWFPEAGDHLRAAGLIDVSFTGFAPIADVTTTTSFYFHRAFDFPLNGKPIAGIGSVPKPKFEKVL